MTLRTLFVLPALLLSTGCVENDPDGGPGPIMTQPDAGSTPVPDAPQTSGGSVMLVTPSLAYDVSTDVYTLSFWLKNNTTLPMRAVTLVRVTGAYSFPEITGTDCPEGTPGYQWDLAPGELSQQLGVAFASRVTNPKTVIDMTCGSISVLKSVPFGFDDAPPFDLHIEGLLGNGSQYVVDATVY